MYINEELEKKIINNVFKKKIYNEFVDLLIGGLIGTFIGFILSLIFKSHESTDYQHVNDSYSNPKSFGAVRQSVEDFQQEIPDLKVEQKIKKEVKKNTDEIYEIDTKLASLIKSKIELINKILILIDGKPENTKNVLESFKNGYIGNKTNDRLKLLYDNTKILPQNKKQNYKNLIENLEQILKDQIKFLRLLKELFLEIDIKIPENKVFEKMYNVHFGERAYEKTKNFANELNKEDKIYFKVKLEKIAKKDLSFKISSISLSSNNDYNLYYDKKTNLVIFNDKNDRYFLEDIDEELFLEIFNNDEITFEKKETNEEISLQDVNLDDSYEYSLEDINNIEEKNILKDADFIDLYNSDSKNIKEYINLFNQKKDVFFNFLDEIIENSKLPIQHTNNIKRIRKDHKDLIKKIDIDSMNDSDLGDIWILDDHATKMNEQFIELKDAYEELLKKLEKNNENITKNDLKINEAFDVHFIIFFTAEKKDFEKKIKDYNDEETKKEIEQYIKKIDEVINQQIRYLKNERKEIIKDDQKTKNYISDLLDYIEEYQKSVKGVFDKFDEKEKKSTDNENSKKEKTLLELTISKIKENKKTGMPISFDLNNKKIKLLDEKAESEHYIVFLPGQDEVKQFEIYSTKNENVLKINSVQDDFILESIKEKYSHKIYEGHYILVKDDNTKEIKIKLQMLTNSLFSKLLNSFSDFKEKVEKQKNTLKEEIKKHEDAEIIEKINEHIKYIDKVILSATNSVNSPDLNDEKIENIIHDLSIILKNSDDFFKKITEQKSEIRQKDKTLLQGIIDTLSVKEKRVKSISYPIKIKDNKITFIEKILDKENEFYIQFNPTDDDMGECKIYSKDKKEIFSDELLEDLEYILFESMSTDFKHEIYSGYYKIEDNKIILTMLEYSKNNVKSEKEDDNYGPEKNISRINIDSNNKKIIEKLDSLKIDDNFKKFIQDVLLEYYIKFIKNKNKKDDPNFQNLINNKTEDDFITRNFILYYRENKKILFGFRFFIANNYDHTIGFFDDKRNDFRKNNVFYFAEYKEEHKFNLIEILRFLYPLIKSEIEKILEKHDYHFIFINNDEINDYILSKITDHKYNLTPSMPIPPEKPIRPNPDTYKFNPPELPFLGFFQEESTADSRSSKIEPVEINNVSDLNTYLRTNKKVYFYIQNSSKPDEKFFYQEINNENLKTLLEYLKDKKRIQVKNTKYPNIFSDSNIFEQLKELIIKFNSLKEEEKINIDDSDYPIFGLINYDKNQNKYIKSTQSLPQPFSKPNLEKSDESYFFGESSEKIWIKSYFSNKK
jgi:gas vesicle protein